MSLTVLLKELQDERQLVIRKRDEFEAAIEMIEVVMVSLLVDELDKEKIRGGPSASTRES